jgi:hypothetical protein
MSVPSIFSTNVRSILNKVDDIQLLLNTKLFSNIGAFLVQETWLNQSIDSDLLTPDGYLCFRQDRSNSSRMKGGGVAIFVKRQWCNNAFIHFQYSKYNIECVSIICKPRYLSGFAGISITNVYIPPATNATQISEFYDELTCSISSILCNNLCLIAGDFNRSCTLALTSLGLKDLVCFNTRGEAQLDNIFTNTPDIFAVRRRAPLGQSDHCVIRLLPKIYSKSNHSDFIQCMQNKIKKRNTSSTNVQNLRSMIISTDFDQFQDPDTDTFVSVFTDYLKFCYDLCCPLETLIVYPNKLSSAYLKQLRRRKELAYKNKNAAELKRLNLLIKHEVSELNRKFTEEIFSSGKPADMWNGLNRLSGKRKAQLILPNSLNDLNESFVYKNTNLVDELKLPHLQQTIFSPVEHHETFNILRKLRCNSSSGSDGLSPAIFKYCAAELAEPVTNILNRTLSSGKVPLSWKSSKIIPLPKPKVLHQEIKYRPIACTSIF